MLAVKHLFTFILASLILTSCSTYSEENLKTFDKEIKAYVKKNKLEMEVSETGLHYQIISEGEGDPILFNDVVAFKYTGKLLNGTVFDKQTRAVEFQVNQLIGAWQEIMTLLKPGGKALLIAPPQLGYGDQELTDIPPNSILVFEIEVVKVK